jgi:hypothetical protein
VSDHLDLIDTGRVEREDTLNANPVGNLPHGKGRPVTTVRSADYRSFEDLDAFFISLDDLGMNTDGVADFEIGNVSL